MLQLKTIVHALIPTNETYVEKVYITPKLSRVKYFIP